MAHTRKAKKDVKNLIFYTIRYRGPTTSIVVVIIIIITKVLEIVHYHEKEGKIAQR
jgi:hypothetical protein